MANPYKDAANAKKTTPGAKKEDEVRKVTEQVPAAETQAQEEQKVETAVNPGQGSQVEESAPVKSDSEKGGLASIYANERKFDIEPRNVRLQVVTTPSVAKKLQILDQTGVIKSRNDLINFLLEQYLATVPGLDIDPNSNK